MINKLWISLIVIGSLFLIFTGNASILNEQILSSGKATLELVMQIFPLVSLWLGIMNIAKDSGLLDRLSHFIYPLLHKIFPLIPKGHESLGYISSNIKFPPCFLCVGFENPVLSGLAAVCQF